MFSNPIADEQDHARYSPEHDQTIGNHVSKHGTGPLEMSWFDPNADDDDEENSWFVTDGEDGDDDDDLLSLYDESSSTVSTDMEEPNNLTHSGHSAPTDLFVKQDIHQRSYDDGFMAGLPVLPVYSLPPNARHCRICKHGYLTAGSESEHPIALPCHHVVGHLCLKRKFSSDSAKSGLICPICSTCHFKAGWIGERNDTNQSED